MGGEAFEFNAVSVRPGDDEDLAIGEDTVDVEDEDFDIFGAGFSGHLLMIACRASGTIFRLASGDFSEGGCRTAGGR
jgi:hypothetical protein